MDTKAIGRRIKQAREHARITQEELAAALDCTPQHISAIERGVKTPRLDTFVTIANTLNVSADALLGDELSRTTGSLANEFAAAVAKLPGETQFRILRAVRAFAEEW